MEEIKWQKISVESLKHGLDQGEKMLKETLETASFQVNRSLTVLKSSMAIFILLFGYVVSSSPELSYKYLEACLALVLFGWIIRRSFLIYQTYEVCPLGNNPSHIIRDENIEYAGKNLYQFLLFNSSRTVEESIEFNQSLNQERSEQLRSLENQIKYFLLVLIVFPFLLFLCSRCVPVLQGVGF